MSSTPRNADKSGAWPNSQTGAESRSGFFWSRLRPSVGDVVCAGRLQGSVL